MHEVTKARVAASRTRCVLQYTVARDRREALAGILPASLERVRFRGRRAFAKLGNIGASALYWNRREWRTLMIPRQRRDNFICFLTAREVTALHWKPSLHAFVLRSAKSLSRSASLDIFSEAPSMQLRSKKLQKLQLISLLLYL